MKRLEEHELEDWQLGVLQYCHKYKDALARDHYRCVLEALAAGKDVPKKVRNEYPTLKKVDAAEAKKLLKTIDQNYRRLR